jgi:hypothetical protein
MCTVVYVVADLHEEAFQESQYTVATDDLIANSDPMEDEIMNEREDLSPEELKEGQLSLKIIIIIRNIIYLDKSL